MTHTPTLPSPPPSEARNQVQRPAQRQQGSRKRPLFDPAIVRRALGDAFVKLDPRHMVRNPVMFVVLLGSAYTTVVFLRDVTQGRADWGFTLQLSLWLWFTVLFANFAEALAEGRGKAQADTLRKSRTQASESASRRRAPRVSTARAIRKCRRSSCVVETSWSVCPAT